MFSLELFGFTINVPAQICGLLGLIIILIAYQFKKRKLIAVQFIGYVFCLAEALFVSAWIGAVITAWAMIRNILIFFFLSKYQKELPGWITITLVIAIWLSCLPFYLTGFAANWYDFFPPILITIATVCAANKNFYIFKIGAITHESGYIVYHLCTGAYIGVVRQIIISIGVLISMYIMSKQDRIKKNQDQINPDTI